MIFNERSGLQVNQYFWGIASISLFLITIYFDALSCLAGIYRPSLPSSFRFIKLFLSHDHLVTLVYSRDLVFLLPSSAYWFPFQFLFQLELEIVPKNSEPVNLFSLNLLDASFHLRVPTDVKWSLPIHRHCLFWNLKDNLTFDLLFALINVGIPF